MTDTIEHEAISEALVIIDESLGRFTQRDLVSADEMSNLLLDLRMALSAAAAPAVAEASAAE